MKQSGPAAVRHAGRTMTALRSLAAIRPDLGFEARAAIRAPGASPVTCPRACVRAARTAT